jgi:hypothetical protein
MYSVESQRTFWRYMLSQSWGLNIKTCSFKTSVDFQRATRRYIPEDRTLHNHCCEKLKSCIYFSYLSSMQTYMRQLGAPHMCLKIGHDLTLHSEFNLLRRPIQNDINSFLIYPSILLRIFTLLLAEHKIAFNAVCKNNYECSIS